MTPYSEGLRTGEQGGDISINPYDYGTTGYHEWDHGFNDGFVMYLLLLVG